MAEDLKEFRLRKQGKVTPKSLQPGLSEWIDTGEVESLIYIVKTTNGEIMTGYSRASNVERLGILEIAKLQIMEQTF